MLARTATVCSSLLHSAVRLIARIPPSLWLKLLLIAALLAIKQGVLL